MISQKLRTETLLAVKESVMGHQLSVTEGPAGNLVRIHKADVEFWLEYPKKVLLVNKTGAFWISKEDLSKCSGKYFVEMK